MMNKKLFQSVSLILLILLITVYCISSSAISTYKFEILSPESVKVGSSFDVKITSKSRSSLKAVKMCISYDSNYISVKSIENNQQCEITKVNDNGKLSLIILFNETLSDGEICTVTFTAKLGVASSNQCILFDVTEAVNDDLSDAVVTLPESVTIKTLKNSDVSSADIQNRTVQTPVQSGNTSSKTSSSSSSNRLSSKNSKSEKSASSGSNSKSAKDKSVKNNSSGNNQSIDNTTSITQPDEESNDIDLKIKEDKGKLVFAGVGLTLSVIGVFFVVYRLGQISGKKNKSAKLFDNDDDF